MKNWWKRVLGFDDGPSTPERHLEIRPTHECFDDAIDFMVQQLKIDPSLMHKRDLLLVHGICLTPDGKPFAHAWVEQGNIVWNSGNLLEQKIYTAIDRKQFYSECRVTHSTKYSPREMIAYNVTFNNFGPWVLEYRKLCLDNHNHHHHQS